MDAALVLRALDEFCGTLEPGDVVPPHQELMRRLGASERSVRWALDELRRQGKIIRRQGSGTFIAERQPALVESAGSVPATLAASRTVVAITEPDRAVFDRAMGLLFRHIDAADLSLVCQLVNPDNGALPIPKTEDERPLGYVVFGRVLLPLAQQLQDAGQRVVLVGSPYADVTPDVPSVQGDQEQGGYLATRHLLDLGHRHIACFGWADWPQTRRWRGHQAALAEARKRGVAVEDRTIFEDEYEQWRSAPEAAEAYFRRPQAPTGIVVWNDHMAVALLTLLSYIGIRVPHDVSLVGYDNLPEGQQVHPPLTTVDGAIEPQLQAALRLLTQPAPPSPSHTVVVLPNLICRDSSAPAAR